MKILRKSDLKSRVSGKAKIYLLSNKDKKFVDETCHELHKLDWMSWSKNATLFSYPVFCVWKTQNEKQKRQVVIDIRGFNLITQSDAYPIPI